MAAKQKWRRFRRFALKMTRIEARIAAKYGSSPMQIGNEMVDLIAAEEDALDIFGLTPSHLNTSLLHKLVPRRGSDQKLAQGFSILESQAEDGPRNPAPLEALGKAVDDEQHSANALPDAGFSTHTYNIYKQYQFANSVSRRNPQNVAGAISTAGGLHR